MALSRYSRNSVVAGGTRYGTSVAGKVIQRAVQNNLITFKRVVLPDGNRLDTIAGIEYGDSTLWWVIAAASKIGWSLQVPPGTVITIPTNLSQIALLVG
jgi:nucleoid-associated protein YgaU